MDARDINSRRWTVGRSGWFGALGLVLLTLGMAPAGAQGRAVPDSMTQVQLSFAPVVKTVAPAVVNVYAQRRVATRSGMLMDDPFFRRFFGDRQFGMPRERMENSLGSGVIVRDNGIVVTNNHVIANGEEFTVVLQDMREFDAEVLLTDERTDLAVLRIDTGGERLPFVDFQNSDEIEVGDLVLAIGNPFGVGQTVTSGIVSAVARTQVGISDLNFFIQTDAAINPGNSGGALVTSDGQLAGINTAIFSRSGGSNGIGFAIPANMVRLVVDSAVAGQKPIRPWLGAAYQAVTSEIAQSFGLDRPGGALITSVFPGGPADEAGLRSGDVVHKIASFDVVDPQALRYRIATTREGSSVPVQFWREGRLRNGTVRVARPPETPPRNETLLRAASPLSGATVVNLSPAFNDENGLDPLQTGVAILKTEQRSYARRARLRSGDIILSVNGRPITRVRDLEAALGTGARAWEIEMKRGGRIATLRYRW